MTVSQTVPEFGAAEVTGADPDADLVVLPKLASSGYAFESRAEVDAAADPAEGLATTGRR